MYFSDSTVDITLQPDGRDTLSWVDVSVRGGRFNHVTRDSVRAVSGIAGGFYGPDAEEAGGVFFNANLEGAFGASR